MIMLYKSLVIMSVIFALMLAVCCQGIYAGKDGLVAHYSFEEKNGDNVLNSSSGKFDGEIKDGVKRVPGINGRGLEFNGKKGKVLISPDSSLDIRDELTVSCWFSPNDISGVQTLFSRKWNWRFRVMGISLEAFVSGEDWRKSRRYISYPLKDFKRGEWYHVAFTYSVRKKLFSLFINGKEVGNIKGEMPLLKDHSKDNIMLGQDPGNYNPFSGKLDEVRIYNRAVGADEIKKCFLQDMFSYKKNLWKRKLVKFKKFIPRDDRDLVRFEQLVRELEGKGCFENLNDYREIEALEQTITKNANRNEACISAKKLGYDNIAYYITKPISSKMILPYTHIDTGKMGKELFLQGCRGECITGSIVLFPLKDINEVRIDATELKMGTAKPVGPDLKIVKCWYQGSTAWGTPNTSSDGKENKRILIPELIVNDDKIIKIDKNSKNNFVKLEFPDGTKYVCISENNPAPFKGEKKFGSFRIEIPADEFPVKDSADLLPFNLSKYENKQMWFTLEIPNDAKPGIYSGTVRIRTKKASPAKTTVLLEIPFRIEVLPFELCKPKTFYDLNKDYTHSIYYRAVVSPDGKAYIGSIYKSKTQMEAELKDMLTHGISNPMICCYDINKDYKNALHQLEENLRLRSKVGMQNDICYLGSGPNLGIRLKTDAKSMELLNKRIGDIKRMAKKYGASEIYFYGIDEAKGKKALAQRKIWKDIHERGGKVFVSVNSKALIPKLADVLDLVVLAFSPRKEYARDMHEHGNRIFCYANPQAGVENPEVYRRNFGFQLWLQNYDGAMTWAYQGGYFNIWNDFDNNKKHARDFVFIYPTVDGVIDTLAWEGYREAENDIRYATTLMLEIQKQKDKSNGKNVTALEAEKYLRNLDCNRDLYEVRGDIIDYILKLKRKQ